MLASSALSGETLLIVTDAWEPQTNGVVTTLKSLSKQLEDNGHTVVLLSPQRFFTVPSFYPNLHLSIPLFVGHHIRMIRPSRILIMTEGPLGLAARWYCARKNIPFITAFTTKWPEYMATHVGFPPVSWGYTLMRLFHRAAAHTLVATASLKTFLEGKGFQKLILWARGVDTQQFYPSPVSQQEAWHPEWPRPLYLYAGRVSPEKNIGAFLDLPLTGTKVVVGSGPALNDFKTQYPHVQFLGLLSGESLRATYSAASVLVFPSHTDTFGLVMLEALACGTPVVAFNVTGPQDVFSTPNPVARLVNTNSQLAEEAQCLAQQKPSLQGQCLAMAQQYSWQNVANTLLAHWPTIAWP